MDGTNVSTSQNLLILQQMIPTKQKSRFHQAERRFVNGNTEVNQFTKRELVYKNQVTQLTKTIGFYQKEIGFPQVKNFSNNCLHYTNNEFPLAEMDIFCKYIISTIRKNRFLQPECRFSISLYVASRQENTNLREREGIFLMVKTKFFRKQLFLVNEGDI